MQLLVSFVLHDLPSIFLIHFLQTHCSIFRYLDFIERAVSYGHCLLLENIGENIDPVLDPLLGRLTIKKGKYIKMGDKEVEYHPDFRLIIQVSINCRKNGKA